MTALTKQDRKALDREKKIGEEREITKLMAQTYHFILTFRTNMAGTEIVHRANCCHCPRKFLATSIGMPINERMIQHFENHHAKGRIQQAE